MLWTNNVEHKKNVTMECDNNYDLKVRPIKSSTFLCESTKKYEKQI